MSEQEKQFVTIDEKKYYIDDMSNENKTRLELSLISERKINEFKAEINLLMIAKDNLVKELKDSLENDNGNSDS